MTGPSVSPVSLWPPNHKLIPVSVDASATDACGGPAACQIAPVGSHEPVDGLGDGNTAPDWTITGPLSAKLRVERSGMGAGRIYTITVEMRRCLRQRRQRHHHGDGDGRELIALP